VTWWLALCCIPPAMWLGYRFAVFDSAHPALGWIVVIVAVAGCIALGRNA